jgi:hypothetical protein
MTSFERKLTKDGKPNPKYIDLLDEDPVIPSQKYICMSFISPEKIIKQREQFMFEKFVQQWDFTKSIEKFGDFLNFVSYKYNLKLEDVLADLKEFTAEEREKLRSYTVEDDYKNFLDKTEDKLAEEFNEKHQFQTSVRGFKFRGAYSSQAEAENRCRKLREGDPNHDIMIGTGFVWTAFDPDAYKTGRVEFMEEELNQLHNEKIKNEEKAKQEFEARVKDAKRKAIEENVRKARETGAKLTQTITEDGTLVGVKETVNFEEREVADDPNKGASDDLNRVD